MQACVCVCVHKIVCLWKNMDEKMEMRVLWSFGLSHPHLNAPGYLIDGPCVYVRVCV